MKISSKGRLATTTALLVIAFIAGMVWWAHNEVNDANLKRRQTMELTRELTNLSLVISEYIAYREEDTRQQEAQISARLDRLVANEFVFGPEQAKVLTNLNERTDSAHRLFEKLVANSANSSNESKRQIEAQLSDQLQILLQESIADALRLVELSHERILAAQQMMVIMILSGLALIALATGSAGWLLNRKVLIPIGKLKQATSELAAGNWNYRLNIESHDEIGNVARTFDAMASSLQTSFAQIKHNNQDLMALNQEIEAFSYSVSHDLRGPLRSMDGFSLALLEDYGDKLDEDAKDSLQRIRAASQRMGHLIDDLFRLSQVTRVELKLESVDLSKMTHEIADSLQQQRPTHDVRWEIEADMTVHADTALIEIAMHNLLDNAWKFTSKTDHPVIRVGTTLQDGRKDYFIADNGVGFEMAHANRLFTAFQRLHQVDEFPGTGIGLAIVQRIFRRHEGKIWVEAKPNSGATFFFCLKEQGHEQRQ